jgi:integrase
LSSGVEGWSLKKEIRPRALSHLTLTLSDNAYNFLNQSLKHYRLTTKGAREWPFALLHLTQSIELMLKQRLSEIHPLFIFQDIDHPQFTVSLEQALDRLNVAGVVVGEKEKTNIRRAVKFRNLIVHYEFESRKEMKAILAACDVYVESVHGLGKENARRLRALILLLRYSGLRIGDAVSLSCDRLKGNRLFLYTQKTSVAVNLILPPVTLRALADTPKVSTGYWFWSGVGKIESCSKHWQARLFKLFKLAKIRDGHARRLRDTFAVELLLAGVPLEQVSVLLGPKASASRKSTTHPG